MIPSSLRTTEYRHTMSKQAPDTERPAAPATPETTHPDAAPAPKEIGGPRGLEPTRYGDWERKGRCIDF